MVRGGKGARDRVSVLPSSLVRTLEDELARRRALHDRDLAAGCGWACLPAAFNRKSPMAGQEFAWPSTSAGPGRRMVKGGSWDDKGCGVCRPAAHHGRPEGLKHILIGFRVVSDQ